jgi:hypothetical protein
VLLFAVYSCLCRKEAIVGVKDDSVVQYWYSSAHWIVLVLGLIPSHSLITISQNDHSNIPLTADMPFFMCMIQHHTPKKKKNISDGVNDLFFNATVYRVIQSSKCNSKFKKRVCSGRAGNLWFSLKPTALSPIYPSLIPHLS